MYSSTGGGAAEVMEGWQSLSNADHYFAGCFEFMGVGVSAAPGADLSYVTLILAKSE